MGTFNDPDTSDQGTPSSATVDWGDGGAPQAAEIVENSDGTYSVEGGHTYADEGDYNVTVRVTESFCTSPPSQSEYSNSLSLHVDYAPLEVTGQTISTYEGVDFTGEVAIVTDTNVDDGGVGSATIDWGDGTTGGGTVVSLGGNEYEIDGAHEYDTAGDYTPTITAYGSAPSTGSGSAAVSAAAITITANPTTVTLSKGGGSQTITITTSAPNVAVDVSSGATYASTVQRTSSTTLSVTFTPATNANTGTENCTITPIGQDGKDLSDAAITVSVVIGP